MSSHQGEYGEGADEGRAVEGKSLTRSTFVGDLRAVLAERGFRRLFATRLISQAGDGIFTAGLGSYVFFSAQSFPNPTAAAVAFAVLYLPYSLIGPFAGVFIDRWSRRQILVWSATLRSGFVLLAATLVGSGTLGIPLYIGVLAVTGVNRFFLSALSAAVPHVVPQDKLVMANSVGPTSGTLVASLGGTVALGVHVLTGGGEIGSAVTLLCGGLCYLTAGLVAARMTRDLLGPNLPGGRSAITGIAADLGVVVLGLAAGARHLARRRKPAAALAATGSFQFLFGILLPMSILLYRNYFYAGSGANAALKHFLVLVVAAGAGRAAAALITPGVTRRMSKVAWIALLLGAGGLVTGLLGPEFSQPGFIALSFVLGITAQGVAICTTTIIHTDVEDEYLGRVFSINDMLYNASFVMGAVVSALFMPADGRSGPLIWLVAIGYLVAAGGYWLASRQPSDSGSPATSKPSPSAQRSSS